MQNESVYRRSNPFAQSYESAKQLFGHALAINPRGSTLSYFTLILSSKIVLLVQNVLFLLEKSIEGLIRSLFFADIAMDWSDHAMWWPEKNIWLDNTRWTLDQYNITGTHLGN